MTRRAVTYCSCRTVFSSLSDLCLALLLAAATSGSAFAQFSSSIEGTVTDASSAVLEGATVRVTNEATGVSSTTKTTSSGYYRVPSLPAGQYRVEASREGFNTAVQSGVVLDTAKVQAVSIQVAVRS